MEVESNNTLHFVDDSITIKGSDLSTNMYKKPIPTERYLLFKSDHPSILKEELYTV
jgi:hypothetical protein